MRKIKVLQVASSLGFGGYERVIANLCRNVDSDRFDVSVLCTKHIGRFGEELRKEGYSVVCLDSAVGTASKRMAPFRIQRFLRKNHFDVVHSHGTSALLDVGPVIPFVGGPLFVHTYHFGNYPHLPFRYLALECVFSRFMKKLVSVSYFQKEALLKTYRLSDSRVHNIWNGVDANTRGADLAKLRKELAIDEGKLVIGTIGNLIEQKGYLDFLEVAKNICLNSQDVVFLIIGGGSLAEELRDIVAESQLEERVLILGYRDDATELLQLFDIFLLTSLWEAMPMVLLEAMAAGKSIVATDVGDNARIVPNGVGGYIERVNDIFAMSARLLHLLQESELRAQMGKANEDRYSRLFTSKVMAKNHENLYHGIIEAEPLSGDMKPGSLA